MGIQLYVSILSVIFNIVSVFLLMASCTYLGYVIRVGIEFKQKAKRWEESERQFEEVMEPMTSYLKQGVGYSEGGFRAYLEGRGIDYGMWRATAEALQRKHSKSH